MSRKNPNVLMLFDKPEILNGDLVRRFPGASFHYATTGQEVLEQLSQVNPDVVFSMKHPAFPGDQHRPAKDHPSVEWIQVGGSGYEQFVPWDRDRVTITNSAGVLARFLAETVTGAMLALNGNFLKYIEQQQARIWQYQGFTPLAGKTLLIAGVGAVGGCVADNAKALGMHVVGVRASGTVHRSVDEMHKPEAFRSLLGDADFVSLHVRLTEETTHLMNEDMISSMKRGSFLLNTARGPVVDEPALCNALDSGHVAGAYLDVFETEPLPAGNPLWARPNVLITPHAADSVTDWPNRFAAYFADNLERWCKGEALLNIVSP